VVEREGQRQCAVSLAPEARTVLRAALIFVIIAIIAAIFGFTRIAAGAGTIAQAFF
jgi:hypothetical protein